MKTTKMSLATIQGKLSRAEMKKIMAGSGGSSGDICNCNSKDDCGSGESCYNGCTGGGKAGYCHVTNGTGWA
jgi:hypothetical protein